MATEIEIKYRVTAAQAEALQARLARLGAYVGAEFEVNTIYAGAQLDPRHSVLRVRRVGMRTLLTYKERYASAAGIKHQREDETEVADADALALILDALGLRPALVYEKRRATWHVGDAEVMLDELPFGWFVEIEGTEETIRAAQRALDLDAAEVEHATYPELTRRFGVAHSTVVAARFEPQA
jgi:adenylate cyclase, class 2